MTKIRCIVCAVFLICTVALIPRPASADVVYTTFGPSGQYDVNVNHGWAISGSCCSNQVEAEPFTLGAGTTVEDAVLALGHVAGDNNPVNVYIESDSGGVPGSIIATLSQAGTILPYSNGWDGGLVTFTCSGCTLGAGSYWLVAQEPDASTEQIWDWTYNDQIALGKIPFNQIGSATGPWSQGNGPIEAFEIDGPASGVPEPASILLFATAALGIGITRRRSISRG
jgi:hypothetical protein